MIAIPLLAGFTLLLGGAELLVRGAAAMALRSGVGPLVVGLTVVAMGTSSPELVVSLRAALQDRGGIAVGNVVGSNICNVALILGLCAMLRPLAVRMSLIRREIPLLILVTAAGWWAARDGVSRGEGVLLAAGLVAYVTFTVIAARRETSADSSDLAGATVVPAVAGRPVPILLLMTAAGIAALAWGADLFVTGAVRLATAVGVSSTVIGLTVVALGTSLPELATSVVATIRGETDLAVGNVVGSNLFNILGILGAAACVHPFDAGEVGNLDQGLALGLAVALLPAGITGLRLSRGEGALFMAVYAGYVAWLFR